MKKIFFTLTVLSTLLMSCNYNEENFPGYDSEVSPTNVVTYNYTLVTADYKTISTAALKIATDKQDSTDASSINTNKYFTDDVPASTYVPLLLATKYPYVDEGSVAYITYNYYAAYDTTTIATANKYTLVADDYNAMGTSSGQPGQYDNFSSTALPDNYIPAWLKLTYPYAQSGDVKLIRYKYYASSVTSVLYGVYTYDGTTWSRYIATNPSTLKFKFKDGAWQFIDSDILQVTLMAGLDPFTAISVAGDQVWASTSSYGAKISGYSSSTYFDNEDWLISPSLDFTDRVTPWLTFDHTGKYFVTMKEEATLWVSTDYTDGKEPSTATWTQVTIPTYMTGSDWTYVSSTPIDLSAYAGESNVHFAFKYLSFSATSAAATWEIKNVYVYEE